MFVDGLLPKAREKLVTIAEDVPLIQVAALLRPGTDLVILCDPTGFLTGIITKTDIVNQISHCLDAGCLAAASSVMTRDVVYCRPSDFLADVWTRMKARGLKNVPVVDPTLRPLGLLHARDILQVLLDETGSEEALLRDYVMGIGYR